MAIVTTPPNVPYLGLPPDEVLDALLDGIVRVKRRAEIYESDGVTPFEINRWNARLITGGSITVDRERDERRMCDLLFENNDNALKIEPRTGFWYDKIIKCFWGISYFGFDGNPAFWEVQTGEFMIDRIDEAYFPNVVKITGRDYTKKCLVSKLKNSLQFPKFTPIEDIIAALAGNAGITKLALPFTGRVYDLDVVFERGKDRWATMKQVCNSIGYECFFRADGYLTMAPYPDPVYSPVAWIFKPGQADGSLVDYNRTSNDSGIKNHIVVTGAKLTDEFGFNETVFGEAINTNPDSPTNVDRIGDRTDFYDSDYITSTAQAQALADSMMRIAALEEYEISFTSVVLPWLDVSQIVDVWDADAAPTTPQRFLLAQLSLSMDLGPMTGLGKRVTIVGTDQTLEYN